MQEQLLALRLGEGYSRCARLTVRLQRPRWLREMHLLAGSWFPFCRSSGRLSDVAVKHRFLSASACTGRFYTVVGWSMRVRVWGNIPDKSWNVRKGARMQLVRVWEDGGGS